MTPVKTLGNLRGSFMASVIGMIWRDVRFRRNLRQS